MSLHKIALGRFTVHGLRDGFFALDGGSMFGVVPKPIWEKIFPADEWNRVRFGLNSILVETPSVNILVDTGIGTLIPEKFLRYYGVDQKHGLVQSLKDLGVAPEEIHYVINTHLHFDHCGWNTRESEKGKIVPTFPKAKYIIQKGEWEYACNPGHRDNVSYFGQTYIPLSDYGLLELVEGETTVTEGVSVIPTPGHTAHHQGVKFVSEGQTLFFYGDAVPTSGHVGLSYIASYDLYPVTTLETKKAILEQAVQEDWIGGFVHDPHHFFGKVKTVKDKFIFESLSA